VTRRSSIRKTLKKGWRYIAASVAATSLPILIQKAVIWIPRGFEELAHLFRALVGHLPFTNPFVFLLLVTGLGGRGVAVAGSGSVLYSQHHLFVGFDVDAQGRKSATGSPWGGLWGVSGSYDYIHGCDWYIGGQASWVTGRAHNGDKHSIEDLDAQGRWGYTCFFRFGNGIFYVTPFMGLGWRELTDRFIGEASGTFTYKKWYLPIGVKAAWLVLRCWELGTNLEFTFDVDPVVRTGSSSVHSELQKEWSFRFELPVTYHHASWNAWGWEARLVPYGRWERFGKPKFGPSTARFREWDGGVLFQLGYRI
jgi:hypothetical protein